ncbi:MAG: hypothetical protein ABSE99_08880 [Terracidiphilus sp.]|jgi:hypothetical protein
MSQLLEERLPVDEKEAPGTWGGLTTADFQAAGAAIAAWKGRSLLTVLKAGICIGLVPRWQPESREIRDVAALGRRLSNLPATPTWKADGSADKNAGKVQKFVGKIEKAIGK